MGLSPAAQAAIAAANKKIIDRDRNPLLADLPPWVRGFRSHQVSAINSVVNAYDRGVPVVVMEAPTGAGKTLIGESVRRMLETNAVYMCSTKSLQDQFLRDYDYAKVLKGRANYPTENYPQRFNADRWADQLSADDCTWNGSRCDWCHGKSTCPYERAKVAAVSSDLCVTNTSYFLGETSMGERSKLAGWGLVIADEADTLESELMNFVSVDISERRMEQWGWYPPEKVTVASSWVEWLDQRIPQLKERLIRMPTTGDVRQMRERKFVAGLLEKLRVVRKGLDDEDHPWVYTGKGAEGSGRIKERNQGRAVSFKPSRVDGIGREVLWDKGERWLLMSATVISAAEMLDSLGYDGEWEFVPVPSTFPVENRRVVVKNVADMAMKKREESWPKMGDGVVEILNRHPNERVLIHAVSYDLSRYLHSRVSNLFTLDGYMRRAVTYGNAAGREQALAEYLSSPSSILVAPSMDRGIDLPGDACRVQVIAKVPFPNLGDRQIAARMHSRGGQTWYNVLTIRTIVQMCGRAVRSAEDHAVTYILDSQFSGRVYGSNRGLIPGWWKDAVVWDKGQDHDLTRGRGRA